MTNTFHPFADESAALTIGELYIENRVDRVSFYGLLDITRDRQGLARAHALKAILDAAVLRLEEAHLPEEVQVLPTLEVPNPFGTGGKGS